LLIIKLKMQMRKDIFRVEKKGKLSFSS